MIFPSQESLHFSGITTRLVLHNTCQWPIHWKIMAQELERIADGSRLFSGKVGAQQKRVSCCLVQGLGL